MAKKAANDALFQSRLAGKTVCFAGRFNRWTQEPFEQFLKDEGVAVVVRLGGGQSSGGTVFGQDAGSRDIKDVVPPPTVALTPEHYNRVLRLLDNKIPVKLEFDIQAKFLDDRTDSVNVIGFYEAHGFQARVSFNWQATEFLFFGQTQNNSSTGTEPTFASSGASTLICVGLMYSTYAAMPSIVTDTP